MPSAREILDERCKEIDAYLDFLLELEALAGAKIPKLLDSEKPITPQQQKILNAAVYMHLYNLVEAVGTRCIESVSEATAAGGVWKPGDLSDSLRKEWVRVMAAPFLPLAPEKRHERALALCVHLVDLLPVETFKIEKGSGNWHDGTVENLSERLGLKLRISRGVRSKVKRKYKDDMGPLLYIKSLRNDLSHGKLSFEECGEGLTVIQLRSLKDTTIAYLREVIQNFESFVSNHEFLQPARRPAPPHPAPAASPV